MRAVFSVVGLLVVLAIVGLVAKKQLQATGQGVAAVAPAASGNVVEQSRQLQQQVKSDVARALEQGAAARKDEADK